jgi:hypothetical protein
MATRRGQLAEPDDAALDEALLCIAALNRTLLQLRRLHQAGRGLRGARCRDCGHRYPCPTARLTAR